MRNICQSSIACCSADGTHEFSFRSLLSSLIAEPLAANRWPVLIAVPSETGYYRIVGTDERSLTNLRRGVLESCALAVIGRGDIYGRDLARLLTDINLLSGEGALYPLLARLREGGLVETRWESSSEGPPRRYYRLTAAGSSAVERFEITWKPFSAAVDRALSKESKL